MTQPSPTIASTAAPTPPPTAAPTTALILVAAGSGSRMGGELPKQLQMLGHRPVIAHTLLAFMGISAIRTVVIVTQPATRSQTQQAIAPYLPSDDSPAPHPQVPPQIHWVDGGATRQASVKAALEYLAQHSPPDQILIHDAARPFASHAMIHRVLGALHQHQAVIPALAITDTIKQLTHEGATQTIPRATANYGLYTAQTPQGFAFGTILDAHRTHQHHAATDDAELIERDDLPIHIVHGDWQNIKLTTPKDWHMAYSILTSQHETKTATGYDVHRLIESPTRPLMLGGIEIPSPLALDGHSDADVVLHALCDAMLGSIAAGDIGQHFPPSDAQWKNASSDQFVQHALQLLAQKNAILRHIDITIIAEAPKISPHRDAIRANIAQLCGIPINRVSVKATTTEGLGFTGRREGIATQAMVTILAPIENPRETPLENLE